MQTFAIKDRMDKGACLPALSGLLLGMTVPPLNAWAIAWVALAPFGLAISRRERAFALYVSAYVGGVLFTLVSLDFIRTGAASNAWSFNGPYVFLWEFVGLVLGATWPMTLAFGRLLFHRWRLPLTFVFPIAWTGCEYIRHLGFYAATGSGFPWLALGITQSEFLSLAQIADLGGVPLITFVVAMVNGLIADLLRSHYQPSMASTRWTRVAAATTLLVVFAALIYGNVRLSQTANADGSCPRVALLPMKLNGDHAKIVERVRQTIGDQAPDLVVFPEVARDRGVIIRSTSEGTTSSTDPGIKFLESLARGLNVPLLVGCRKQLEEDEASLPPYNSLLYILPSRGYFDCYDKVSLVPFVEYNPFSSATIHAAAVSLLVPASDPRLPLCRPGGCWKRFSLPLNSRVPDCDFGVSLCNDICFPEAYAGQLRTKPAFFVCSGFESEDRTLRAQRLLLAMARFRAIESRRSVCRSCTGGYTAILDGSGRIVAMTKDPMDMREGIVAGVPLDGRSSLYASVGDWPAFISACLLAGTAAFALAETFLILLLRPWRSLELVSDPSFLRKEEAIS